LFKKILVPTDGLLHSRKACEYAARLAKLTEAQILGLHVVPSLPVRLVEPSKLTSIKNEYRKYGESYLKQVEEICSSQAVKCRTILAEGIPSEEIMRIALREDVDLIVIGIRRKGSVEKFVTGRVSDEIIRNASCPVVVINTPW
jgi:nucleotide-binding universal stress UspA family protein